ncbi:glycosyltransferase family 39 protein [Pseudomonas abieticivorans]|uniref:glycosyltransferase family 39 protein n=1 Tax=Pseudomonas abieticivorans TaxID=2931382 RepID=UPI0020BF51FA|nr:glycosyltransferase family 39 protein [Pseudomonas sp. PIA16]
MTASLPTHLAAQAPVGVLWRAPQLWWLLALALGVRAWQLGSPVLWYDEAYSVMLGQLPLGQIWALAGHDVHPPLYYLLLHGWMALFGDSVPAVRSLSVLAGGVSVLLAVWLVRLLATARAAWLAGLLLAVLPIAVRYSQEARMYALLVVWLLGATLALVYWLRAPARVAPLVVYGLLMSAGFYTHYFTALAVLAHWSYLALARLRTGNRGLLAPRWWLVNAAIAACFLPWVPHLLAQLAGAGNLDWVPAPTAQALPGIFWQFLILGPGSGLPAPIWWLLPLVVWAVLGTLVWRDRGERQFDTLLVCCALVPLLGALLMSLQRPLFYPRYLIFAASMLPVVLGVAIDRGLSAHRPAAALLLAMTLWLSGLGLFNLYTVGEVVPGVDAGDNRLDEVGAYVNQHYRAQDALVVDAPFWYFSVAYYNRTPATPWLLTAPSVKGRPKDSGAPSVLYPRADSVFLDRFSLLPASTCRLWLIGGANFNIDDPELSRDWLKTGGYQQGRTIARLYERRGAGCTGEHPPRCCSSNRRSAIAQVSNRQL